MKIAQFYRNMKIEKMPVASLVPYENNPRINDDAVPGLAASIRKFGFRNPILVDANNVIVEGHTRRLAAIELGMKEVPVIRVTDLSPKQVAALRLVDNKVAEMSSWDYSKLDAEIDSIMKMDGDDLDLGDVGFPSIDDDPFGETEPQASGDSPQDTAVAAGGGAAVQGVQGTLPPELAGVQLKQDEQEKIDTAAETNKERIIIVFDPSQRGELAAILGFNPDKVVMTLDEILERNGNGAE